MNEYGVCEGPNKQKQRNSCPSKQKLIFFFIPLIINNIQKKKPNPKAFIFS